MFNDNDYVSEEDREIINLEVKLIGKMIEAREKQGLTQRDLAKISGVKQPAIARIESLRSTPQLDTLLKVLIWCFSSMTLRRKRAVRHGLPFGSYITLTDMVRSSLETT